MIGSALQIDPTTPIEYTDPAKIPTFIQGEIAANKNLITKAPSGNYYGISQYVAGEIINPFVSQANNTGKFTGDKMMASMVIYRANLIIDNIKNPSPYQKLVIAEAKAMRAYVYFELGTLYGPVPLVLHELQPTEYAQGNSTM